MTIEIPVIRNIMEKDMININIIYKLINGNGKVKEYDDENKLRFEGEYLNRKRNGKGKEYDSNGQLEFEGNYFKWRKNLKKIIFNYS